jgi:FkbM family methyltransferase
MRGYGAIIEAGSSDGVDTVRLAQEFTTHRIIAIEPIVEQYSVTREKTSNFYNVETYNLALSTKTGTVEMYVGRSGQGIQGMGSSSLLKPTRHKLQFPEISFDVKQKVHALKMEEFCSINNINFVDLLWLDIQGLELSLVAESSEFFRESVNLIHMEVSRVELYDGTALYAEVLDTMAEFGFRALKKRVGRVSGNCLFQNQKFKTIN